MPDADPGPGRWERYAEDHGGTHHARSLRLTCHRLNCVTGDDADADARTDGGETEADQGERARDVTGQASGSLFNRQDQRVHSFPFVPMRLGTSVVLQICV